MVLASRLTLCPSCSEASKWLLTLPRCVMPVRLPECLSYTKSSCIYISSSSKMTSFWCSRHEDMLFFISRRSTSIENPGSDDTVWVVSKCVLWRQLDDTWTAYRFISFAWLVAKVEAPFDNTRVPTHTPGTPWWCFPLLVPKSRSKLFSGYCSATVTCSSSIIVWRSVVVTVSRLTPSFANNAVIRSWLRWTFLSRDRLLSCRFRRRSTFCGVVVHVTWRSRSIISTLFVFMTKHRCS